MIKNLFVISAVLPFLMISIGTIQDAHAASINGLCVNEQDFTNWQSITLDQIRQFLTDKDGFMKNPFTDVDGVSTVGAQEIYNAGTTNAINPQVLLATLQKESRAITRKQRPDDNVLKCLAGWGPNCSSTAREQIRQMGAQLRRDFDRNARCEATLGGWMNDDDHPTGSTVDGVLKPEYDPSGQTMSATPENKAVSALYQYTSWAGAGLGGGRRLPGGIPTVGGNGSFCELWNQYQFVPPSAAPLAIRRTQAIVQCSPNNPSPTASKCANMNASGGTPPYNWSTTKGDLSFGGVNNQNAKITAPASTNPPGVAASFYTWYRVTGVSGQNQFSSQDFGCNFVPSTQCFTVLHNGCTPASGADMGPCRLPNGSVQTVDVYSPGNPSCVNPVVPEVWVTSPSQIPTTCGGYVCDKRTQTMINQGCKPCGVEMQGGTVTVTDVTGAQVAVPVTVK